MKRLPGKGHAHLLRIGDVAFLAHQRMTVQSCLHVRIWFCLPVCRRTSMSDVSVNVSSTR